MRPLLFHRSHWQVNMAQYIYCLYLNIYCFKLCNNYQKSFNPSTIHPLVTISKVISNQHRNVKWEKSGRVDFFLNFFVFFASALKIGFWGLWITAVKISLMKIPCTIKHFREEKKPHRNWMNKGKVRSTKKTGTFPFFFFFKQENPNSEKGSVILFRHLRVAIKPRVAEIEFKTLREACSVPHPLKFRSLAVITQEGWGRRKCLCTKSRSTTGWALSWQLLHSVRQAAGTGGSYLLSYMFKQF